MTIAVGALHKTGAVVGADRMLELGGTGRANADCNFQKVFFLEQKYKAFAVAGDIQLSFCVPGKSEHIVCDLANLVSGAFRLNNASGLSLATSCLDAYYELGRLLQYDHFDAEVLVVERNTVGYGLWSRSRTVRQGAERKVREVAAGQLVLGIGYYKSYVTFLTESHKLKTKERNRLEGLTPPPKLPDAVFPDATGAEKWVRAVIKWCCSAFPDQCGGDLDVFQLS